ncbi:MAG: sugar ABC transporter substrate-binding protein [Tissierellia bacterium]|jgi:ABC-type sugar transport system substrate-binding protein|nr:substrate-binding domain-containing protein [Bacillota bacterium]NLK58051.1 sugar ABC transporter substrate-binding protein [Tissierellia bacterium]
MKKWLLVFVSLLLVFAMGACSTQTETTEAPDTTEAATEAQETEAPEETEAESVQTEDEEAQTPADALIAFTKAELDKQLAPLPESGQNEKVGALIISLTNPFWVNMENRYMEAAEELGIQLEVLSGTTEGDTTSQLETLMTMATKDYDAIILSPIEGTNLIPGIVQANQNEIPVINLGPGVDEEALQEAGGHLDGKITVNFEEQGEMVANDMIGRLPDGGQVAILQGLSGAGQSEGRTAGAQRVFEANDTMELVAVQPCDWDATIAYDATKDIITANPDLKGIFAVNDVMALAAVEALKSEGREDVLVYGVDFTDDAKAAIQAGEMTGSVTYSTEIYTQAGLMMAMKIAQGQELTEPVYCPLTLVTVDTVDQYEDWR